MSDQVAQHRKSMEKLIRQFEEAQKEAVARFDGLIDEARFLQDQRNLFEEVIENCRDAIFVLEKESGVVRHVNEAASRMLGIPVEEMRGRPQIELFPDHLKMRLLVHYRRLQREGWIADLRTQLERADGTRLDVAVSANLLPEAYEGLVVTYARDITNRVAAEREMKALNETLEKRVVERTNEIACANEELEMAIREANRHAMEADAANKAKSFFIANMTHEIRTPLNSISGMLELLDDMELGNKQRDTLNVVRHSADILANLINQILDFSKIEANKLELEQIVFLLPELVQQIMDTMGVQARDKGLALEMSLDDEVPEYVVGDPGRLRQVLLNLLGNAIKFTEAGGVKLSIDGVRENGRRLTVKFAVSDTGVGIPAEYRKDLFTPFTQADASVSRKFGGTGLGLHISNSLVEKMGGRLDVQSEVGKGSTFFFDVHFEKAGDAQIEDLLATRETVSGSPCLGEELDAKALRLLLVEDNKFNQRVALGMLEKLGCTAEVAENGIAALRLLDEKVYDLIFMDLQMPEMGGLETVGILRSGRAGRLNRETPVVAMTAHASREDRKECLVAGMNDYLSKPVCTDGICQVLRRVLLDEGAGEGFGDAGVEALDVLIKQTGGDAELAMQVLDSLLSDARHQLNLIIGAVQNHDYGFAQDEAHVLEGQALKLGSAELTAGVTELIAAVNRKQQDLVLELAEQLRSGLDMLESKV
jgi:PAS domain S-box-containing protein